MSKSSFEGFPSPKPNKGGTNTGDATATAADIALNKTAYAVGVKLTGTNTNKPHASGSGTAPTNAGNLYTDNTGASQSFNTFTITGLNFPNGIDCIRIVVPGYSLPTLFSSIDIMGVANCKIVVGSGATEYFIKLQGNASVTTTSFQLPNSSGAGNSFTWDVWGL